MVVAIWDILSVFQGDIAIYTGFISDYSIKSLWTTPSSNVRSLQPRLGKKLRVMRSTKLNHASRSIASRKTSTIQRRSKHRKDCPSSCWSSNLRNWGSGFTSTASTLRIPNNYGSTLLLLTHWRLSIPFSAKIFPPASQLPSNRRKSPSRCLKLSLK